MPEFSHLDADGRVRMVDVSDKTASLREAVARGVVTMKTGTLERITRQTVKKGNVFETARIAGILAAKRTGELIPLCHPLNLSHVQIDFLPNPDRRSVTIEATVRVHERTGVEMEALLAVSVAALTLYDMCKSVDRGMTISDICLLEKRGGKSGHYRRPRPEA